MKPIAAKTILTVLVLLAAQGGHALADPVYFDFESRVYPVPNSGGSGYDVSFTPASPPGDGLADISSGYGTHVAGSSTINLAVLNWQVNPLDFGYNPGQVGPPSTFNTQPFKLALTLTDEASHTQGTLSFQGTFNSAGTAPLGTLSFASSIQSLVLGHNSYTVDLSQQTSWAIDPNQMWMLMAAYGGEYRVPAQVTVQSLPVQSAPEPTSLTLAALGLVTILGNSLHRGRRRKLVRL
jgi:hypothetical protein